MCTGLRQSTKSGCARPSISIQRQSRGDAWRAVRFLYVGDNQLAPNLYLLSLLGSLRSAACAAKSRCLKRWL